MAALNGICLFAVARVRLPDVPDMVRRGEITDAEPLAALLDALLELGRVGRPPRG